MSSYVKTLLGIVQPGVWLPDHNLEQMGYQWHWLHPFIFDDSIGLLYELDRLLSWELPICLMYS